MKRKDPIGKKIAINSIATAMFGILTASQAFASPEVEALKQELSQQRLLIEKLLAAQEKKTEVSATATPVAAPQATSDKPLITLYGVADLSVSSADSGYGNKINFGSNGFSASRLGIKAEYGVANDLQVLGVLEAGISLDNGVAGSGSQVNGANTTPSTSALAGNGSQIFSRQAFGGLKGNFGTVTIGRQYSGSYMAVAAYGSAKGDGLYGYSGGFIPLVGGMPTRVDNSLVYASPRWNGLSSMLTMTTGSENNLDNPTATGTTTTTDEAGRGADLAFFYTGGNLNAAFTTWNLNNGSYATVGETGLAKKKGYQLAANYDFQFMKLYGNFAAGEISGGNYENVTKTRSDASAFGISVLVPYGKHRFIVAYTDFNDKSLQNKDAKVYGLGYWYELNKYTKLYASWGKVSNNENANYSLVDAGSQVGKVSAAGVGPSSYMAGVNFAF